MLLSPTPLVMPGMPTGGNLILALFYFFFIFPFFHLILLPPPLTLTLLLPPPHHLFLTRPHPRRAQSAVLTAPPRVTVVTEVGLQCFMFFFLYQHGVI